MDSMAVANEGSNHYQSFGMDGHVTASDALALLVENVSFAGPFTLVEERDVYLPQEEDAEGQTLYPDKEIIVYDSYGPHGIQRVGTGFKSTAEVKAWIDEELEPEGAGEYAIGQVIDPEGME